MKKLLICFCIIIGSFGSLLATPWKDYTSNRIKAEKASDAGNVLDMRMYTEKAIAALTILGRTDLIAWRLNNYAFLIINKWQEEVGYVDRFDTLTVAVECKEKQAYIKETRELFKKNGGMLVEAQEILYKAKLADDAAPVKFKNLNRTAIIARNIAFVQSMINYINDK